METTYKHILLGNELEAIYRYFSELEMGNLRLVCQHWYAMTWRHWSRLANIPARRVRPGALEDAIYEGRYMSAVVAMCQPKSWRVRAGISTKEALLAAINMQQVWLIEFIMARFPHKRSLEDVVQYAFRWGGACRHEILAVFTKYRHFAVSLDHAVAAGCVRLARQAWICFDVDAALMEAARQRSMELVHRVFTIGVDGYRKTRRGKPAPPPRPRRLICCRTAFALLAMPEADSIRFMKKVVYALSPAAAAEYHWHARIQKDLDETNAYVAYEMFRSEIVARMDHRILCVLHKYQAILAFCQRVFGEKAIINVRMSMEELLEADMSLFRLGYHIEDDVIVITEVRTVQPDDYDIDDCV